MLEGAGREAAPEAGEREAVLEAGEREAALEAGEREAALEAGETVTEVVRGLRHHSQSPQRSPLVILTPRHHRLIFEVKQHLLCCHVVGPFCHSVYNYIKFVCIMTTWGSVLLVFQVLVLKTVHA